MAGRRAGNPVALPISLQFWPNRWSNQFGLSPTNHYWLSQRSTETSELTLRSCHDHIHASPVSQPAFKPTSWSHTVICSLREYAYSQWKEHNSHTNGVDLKAFQALQRQHAQQQITTAYHKKPSIPCDKQSFTFGIPLTDRLLQPTSLLNAWLLQYQARHHRLTNQLKQVQCYQGKITKFLIAWITGWRLPTPPD